MTSSSCSDDDSDTNDAAMTSYRDATAGRRGPSVSGDQLASSPVTAGSPTDVVETFDIYYMLPSTKRERVEHRGLQPPAASRWVGCRNWDHHGELTLNERRRPDVNCLLDAVPPTPTCCNDLRAATLPASRLNDWTSPPPTGFVSSNIINYHKNQHMTANTETQSSFSRPVFPFLHLISFSKLA